jgi:hypothetical protein
MSKKVFQIRDKHLNKTSFCHVEAVIYVVKNFIILI